MSFDYKAGLTEGQFLSAKAKLILIKSFVDSECVNRIYEFNDKLTIEFVSKRCVIVTIKSTGKSFNVEKGSDLDKPFKDTDYAIALEHVLNCIIFSLLNKFTSLLKQFS